MVTTSGFTHAPVSRALILLSVFFSIGASITDVKYLLPIKPTPHLWPYLQFSRLLTFQAAFTSGTELLFSTVLLYQFRVVERLWGSRKYASFIVLTLAANSLLIPLTCILLKFGTWGYYNYVPSGVAGLVFAALSIWGDEVPRLYRYKIVTGRQEGEGGTQGVVLSDKTTTYVLAAQLALSQFPFQLMPAVVGWIVGSAWSGDLLPGGMSRWRVPGWVVGESKREKDRGQYEGLRRRLEEEGSSADGMRNVSDQAVSAQGEGGRRGFARQVLGYFTSS